jgi:metal-responsive CopG/Arc/MetJ family transcriptional regulator
MPVPKMRRVMIQLPAPLLGRLDLHAAASETSRAEAVRHALERYLRDAEWSSRAQQAPPGPPLAAFAQVG